MGKLTYSARKNSGVKAGQVVSKDLKKRIPPGTGSKAAARDPTLEIDLAGKSLGDEGFAQFIDDLIKCIKYKDEEHTTGLTKVTELHLQGNQLTSQSLLKLGEVIALSHGDIREIDLSDNDIQVVTPEDKERWAKFLDSFKNCYMLKKVDLGSNPLGPAGLEILARTYIKSDLDYLEAEAEAVIGPKLGEYESLAHDVEAMSLATAKENENPGVSRVKKSPNKGKTPRSGGSSSHSTPGATSSKVVTIADLKKFACTRGLRSVPFLIVSNIELKNSSAVHLASMLDIQRTPDQLLDFLPASKTCTLPNSAENCKSIIWCPNEGLAPFANRLLEVTETLQDLRAHTFSDNEETDSDEDNYRKVKSKMELDHTRLSKRVRLESLKQEGVRASQIAFTALKMMLVARALLLEDKDRVIENPPDYETAVMEDHGIEEEHIEEGEVIAEFERGFPAEHLEYAYLLPMGPFHPSALMFDSEFPALQSTSSIEGEIVEAEPEVTEVTESRASQPSRSGKGSNRHGSPAQKAPKEEWRRGLPFELWRRIIADAVGADGILDRDQQAQIMHYASDWDVMAYKLTIKGVEDHQQVWKFLETVGCFTYTPLC